MTTAQEALGQRPPLGATLEQGVDWLSGAQDMTFRLYNIHILPLDGFVFWVRDGATAPKTVKGSIHFSTDTDQTEDETAASNRVIFTALEGIDDLNAIEPGTMWIGEYQGLKIGFSSRGKYYRQASLHHYSGVSLAPALWTQILDDASSLTEDKLIVSNSLPAFLFLNTYVPPYTTPLQIGGLVTLYPSFLAPENIRPPYAAVHIERTESLQAAPFLNARHRPFALAQDDIRITIYGLDNPGAHTLRDTILAYSQDWDVFGIIDASAIQDEKRPQAEFGILAQKKTLRLKVSYQQAAIRDVARQMLQHVQVSLAPNVG